MHSPVCAYGIQASVLVYEEIGLKGIVARTYNTWAHALRSGGAERVVPQRRSRTVACPAQQHTVNLRENYSAGATVVVNYKHVHVCTYE